MPFRTTFLARLIGFYCIVVALFMGTHKQAVVDIVTAIVHSQAQLFVAGLVALVCGLALVLGHNVWSGGTVPVIVTLVGWVSLLKGIVLLFLTPAAASVFFLDTLRYEALFYGYSAFTGLLGVFLVAMSFRRAVPDIAVTSEAHFFAELTRAR